MSNIKSTVYTKDIKQKERNPQGSTSRYANSYLLYDDQNLYQPARRRIKKVEPHDSDLFHIVKAGEIGRLDLIAYKYYNQVKYWWIIADVNNIKNQLVIQPGTTLRIPLFNRLVGVYI